MEKLIMYKRYVTQVWHVCKRALGFVNVFKKKSCGASPLKGEEIKEVGSSRILRINESTFLPYVQKAFY